MLAVDDYALPLSHYLLDIIMHNKQVWDRILLVTRIPNHGQWVSNGVMASVPWKIAALKQPQILFAHLIIR